MFSLFDRAKEFRAKYLNYRDLLSSGYFRPYVGTKNKSGIFIKGKVTSLDLILGTNKSLTKRQNIMLYNGKIYSKTVSKYKAEWINGKNQTTIVRTKFPTRWNFSDRTRCIDKDTLNSLPLPITKYCHWIGRTFHKPKTRVSFDKYIDVPFSSYVKELTDPESVKAYSFRLISGSYATQFPDLVGMGKDNNHKITYDLLDKAILSRLGKLELPKVETPPVINDLRFTKINHDAFPGHITSKIFNKSKKGAFCDSVVCAEELYKKLEHVVFPDSSLWEIGSRPRLNDIFEDELVRSRVLYMPEFAPTLLAQIYSEKLTTEMQKLQENKLCEIFLGDTLLYGGWDKFYERFHKEINCFEGDWSKHDQTVSEETIVMAFCMLRSCFPASKLIDNHFLFIMSGFIFSNVVLPDGFIYKYFKGIRTGSPFTSWINTLCNWIQYTTLSLTTNTPIDTLIVYGDDTFGCLSPDIKCKPQFVEHAESILGMKLKGFKISTFTGSEEESDKLEFLQISNHRGMPGRKMGRIIELLSISDKRRITSGYLINRTMSIVTTGVLNLNGFEFCSTYLNRLYCESASYWSIPPPDQVYTNKVSNELLTKACELYYLKPDKIFNPKNTYDFREKVKGGVGVTSLEFIISKKKFSEGVFS